MTRLVALDTETTGLKSKEGDRIVEIAMVEITRSANPRYFQSYFNPGDREVHPEAFAVHGLSNEFLKGAPTFEEKLPEIFDFRSEEHTSELQSLMRISYAVFCLKKKHTHIIPKKNIT